MVSRVTAIGLGLAASLALSGCVTHSSGPDTLSGELPSHSMTGMTQPVEGVVTRVDVPQRVVVLDNGRMYQVPGDSAVLINGQPVVISSVQPGSRVTLTSPTVVEYRDGRYIAVAPGAPAAVVTAPAAPSAVVAAPAAPSTVVTTPGASSTTVVTAPAAPAGIRQTIYGRVTDVDRDEIRVKTDRDSFEIRMPNANTSGIRKGDMVQLDVTINPAAPSASPRTR
jgi:hypothetical protein